MSQLNLYLPTDCCCRLVPESIPWKHSCEGPDDMPAHAKACLLGSNLTLPICDGRVTLGTWQGVWLCEHRCQQTSAVKRYIGFTISFHNHGEGPY